MCGKAPIKGLKMSYKSVWLRSEIKIDIFTQKTPFFNTINALKKCRKTGLKSTKTPLIFVDLRDYHF